MQKILDKLQGPMARIRQAKKDKTEFKEGSTYLKDLYELKKIRMEFADKFPGMKDIAAAYQDDPHVQKARESGNFEAIGKVMRKRMYKVDPEMADELAKKGFES